VHDSRLPEELFGMIEAKRVEVAEAVKALRALVETTAIAGI
jgi:hypothetical protein